MGTCADKGNCLACLTAAGFAGMSFCIQLVNKHILCYYIVNKNKKSAINKAITRLIDMQVLTRPLKNTVLVTTISQSHSKRT